MESLRKLYQENSQYNKQKESLFTFNTIHLFDVDDDTKTIQIFYKGVPYMKASQIAYLTGVSASYIRDLGANINSDYEYSPYYESRLFLRDSLLSEFKTSLRFAGYDDFSKFFGFSNDFYHCSLLTLWSFAGLFAIVTNMKTSPKRQDRLLEILAFLNKTYFKGEAEAFLEKDKKLQRHIMDSALGVFEVGLNPENKYINEGEEDMPNTYSFKPINIGGYETLQIKRNGVPYLITWQVEALTGKKHKEISIHKAMFVKDGVLDPDEDHILVTNEDSRNFYSVFDAEIGKENIYKYFGFDKYKYLNSTSAFGLWSVNALGLHLLYNDDKNALSTVQRRDILKVMQSVYFEGREAIVNGIPIMSLLSEGGYESLINETNNIRRIEMNNSSMELQVINFHGDEIQYVELSTDGKVYIPVKRIAENIGLKWKHEHQRIMSDAVLSAGILKFGIPREDASGRIQNQEMVCLPFDMINGYLFGIPITERTRPEIKEKLIEYKMECFKVLNRHFSKSSDVDPDIAVITKQTKMMSELNDYVAETVKMFGMDEKRRILFASQLCDKKHLERPRDIDMPKLSEGMGEVDVYYRKDIFLSFGENPNSSSRKGRIGRIRVILDELCKMEKNLPNEEKTYTKMFDSNINGHNVHQIVFRDPPIFEAVAQGLSAVEYDSSYTKLRHIK